MMSVEMAWMWVFGCNPAVTERYAVGGQLRTCRHKYKLLLCGSAIIVVPVVQYKLELQ